MKRMILVLLFGCLCFYAFPQQGYLFINRFKPDHTYFQVVEQKTHSESRYNGNEAFMKSMKEKGVRNPDIVDSEQKLALKITTTSAGRDSSFRAVIEFLKTTGSNGNQILPEGTKLFGRSSKRSLIAIDSVTVTSDKNKYDDKFIFECFESTVLRMEFPKKEMKVGESFYTQVPYTFPVPNEEPVRMTIATTYKLLSVSGDSAIFDIIQNYKMDFGKPELKPLLRGEAKGIMLFDVKENFYRLYELNTVLSFKKEQEEVNVETTTHTNYNIRVGINGK